MFRRFSPRGARPGQVVKLSSAPGDFPEGVHGFPISPMETMDVQAFIASRSSLKPKEAMDVRSLDLDRSFNCQVLRVTFRRASTVSRSFLRKLWMCGPDLDKSLNCQVFRDP
jgi:hypothetical protein